MNRENIISYLENNVYGVWRSGERVSYELLKDHKVKISVSCGNKSAHFTLSYVLPEKETLESHLGKCPFFVCMHEIGSYPIGLKKGYAYFFMDTKQIAEDNNKHEGAFYELYPYTGNPKSQTGVLMAWAWGASKVLDAVYGGLGQELHLDAEMSLATGVSRWGKAVAVLGVFDYRFKMIIPACSGAGGLALYKYCSTGLHYDFSDIGGPSDYIYGENEPLSCLQSEAEQGWFVDAFLEYQSPKDLPYDQDVLPKLAAGGNRSYFIVAAHMNEDWVNAPSMWQCYLLVKEYYAKENLSARLFAHFHKEGHGVIDEDMELITKAFDDLYYPQWWVEKHGIIEEYRKANQSVKKGATVFVGSSLMEMFPVETFAKEDGLTEEVVNRGISGYKTHQLMEVLDICATDLQPGKVFINIGTNDLSDEYLPVEEVMRRYEQILEEIEQKVPKVKIHLMAYYPINRKLAVDEGMARSLDTRTNEKIAIANEMVREIAQRRGYTYIDANGPLMDKKGRLKKEYCLDGMHMKENAYRAIWPIVKEYLS